MLFIFNSFVRMILPAWFDDLLLSVSFKTVQFKRFSPPVKTICPPAENMNETPIGGQEMGQTTLTMSCFSNFSFL